MNSAIQELDADALLRRVGEQIPDVLRGNVVVIGSIATAWAFRDVAQTAMVATKDIDLLLRPSVDAVSTAKTLGQSLLAEGWEPTFPNGITPGVASTPDDQLPALRLTPPGGKDGWFVELLADPPPDQSTNRPTNFGGASTPCKGTSACLVFGKWQPLYTALNRRLMDCWWPCPHAWRWLTC